MRVYCNDNLKGLLWCILLEDCLLPISEEIVVVVQARRLVEVIDLTGTTEVLGVEVTSVVLN